MRLWQKRRARADNISAIVVFLDDEFKSSNHHDDDDNESVASSEADTDIVCNGEDDTPPMVMAENSINTLVRQLALPYGGNRSDSGCGSSSIDEVSGMKSTKDELSTTSPHAHHRTDQCSSKRKIGDDCSNSSVPPSKQRKSGSCSPPSGTTEESHQCNVITVLSTESLYGLQLDESLEFVDESDDSEESNTSISGGKNMEEHLNYMPIPQVTK